MRFFSKHCLMLNIAYYIFSNKNFMRINLKTLRLNKKTNIKQVQTRVKHTTKHLKKKNCVTKQLRLTKNALSFLIQFFYKQRLAS